MSKHWLNAWIFCSKSMHYYKVQITGCHLARAFVTYRPLQLGLVVVMIQRCSQSAWLRLLTPYSPPLPQLAFWVHNRQQGYSVQKCARWGPREKVSKLLLKGQIGNILAFASHLVSCNYSTLPLLCESSHRLYVNKWPWLYSNITSLMDNEIWISCNFHVPWIIRFHLIRNIKTILSLQSPDTAYTGVHASVGGLH